MEKTILAAIIQKRDSYERLSPFIQEEDFDGVSKLVLRAVADYYDRDDTADSCDVTIIRSSIVRTHPRFVKDVDMVLESLPDVSTSNVEHEFVSHKRGVIGQQLAAALSMQNHKEASDLIEEYQLYSNSDVLTGTDETTFNGDIARVLQAVQKNSHREFVFRPRALQEATGGAGRGDHILIYGRPNSGKSLQCINSVAWWLKDGHRVLYIGNEDSMDRMLARFVSRMSGTPVNELDHNMDNAVAKAMENGLANLDFREMSPGTFREINSIAKRTKPDIIVLDQIRNIALPRIDGLTAQLERASIEARNLAKRHKCLVLSVTQAGESAKNRLVLDMEDIDSSKTGLQAQLDCMIGIGVNAAYEAAGRRMVSVRKNKLGGRDEQFPIRIDPTKSKAMTG